MVVAFDEAIEHPNLASHRAALERIQAKRKAELHDKRVSAEFSRPSAWHLGDVRHFFCEPLTLR